MLVDALTQQIDLVPVPDISITRLVEAAGVTRPTFYQHFADIPDAARRAALTRLASAFPMPDAAKSPADITHSGIHDRIVAHAQPVLIHLQAHREFYLRVLGAGSNADFFEEIIRFISNRLLPEVFDIAAKGDPDIQRDLNSVTAGGIMWMMIRWLRDEQAEDPAAMARRCAAIALAMMKP